MSSNSQMPHRGAPHAFGARNQTCHPFHMLLLNPPTIMDPIRIKHQLLHPCQTMPHLLLHHLAKLLQPRTSHRPSRVGIRLCLQVRHRSHHFVKAHLPELVHGHDSYNVHGRRCGAGLGARAEENLDVDGFGDRASVLAGVD